MGNNRGEVGNSGGIGIVGLLGVVFITLKLCDVIDWSWWWVTLPFWGGLAVITGVWVIFLLAKTMHNYLSGWDN